jgi:hypothetical protein
MDELSTASDVIDECGGTGATADLTQRPIQSVSNWRAANKLPAATFIVITAELKRRGKTAPPSLWGMVEPSDCERAAS